MSYTVSSETLNSSIPYHYKVHVVSVKTRTKNEVILYCVVQIPCVVLLGILMWCPNEFLNSELPHMAGTQTLANVRANRVAYLQQTEQGLIA